ncbi:hypothetical protein HK413_11700 [Mucilaginibacter sp. S1162]|uniref:Uncharacterized protein n=1 Tax=Mucilaginibacter humi TaxID=2732510 RepID=A0ABX1W6E3_9SPHI|nr:hypothetical protein [Mucilaginibacter humi]NNU34580.1 hypothetical protein [Mucilaginibacter humi]
MATKYANQLKKDLQAMFPDLSDVDATALSWQGLGETQAWKDMVAKDALNGSTVTNDIVNINKKFKDATGTKGHRCP